MTLQNLLNKWQSIISIKALEKSTSVRPNEIKRHINSSNHRLSRVTELLIIDQLIDLRTDLTATIHSFPLLKRHKQRKIK